MTNPPISPKLLLNPIHCLTLGFGTGLSPKAPGTLGTLVGVVFCWWGQSLPVTTYVLVVALGVLVGCVICGYTANVLGVHDHGGIVWDEVMGMMIAGAALPAGWIWLLLAFALFRVLDIAKPWPIRLIDRQIKGGTGIMLDDVLAGLGALVVVQTCAWIFAP